MNNRIRCQLLSLVMALVMILGNTIPSQAAAPALQTSGPSIYWGAMVDGKVPSTTNLEGVMNTFEMRSNKRMSIIHWGQPWKLSDGSWGEFQTSYFGNVRSHGSIPMINWASQKLGAGTNQADFQLRDIYNGNYDAYITRWATDAKNWGHPFFLRFNHEMNGWWYPWAEGKASTGVIVNGNSSGDFIRAWRHVHDIFTSVGATNVTWVWAANQVGTSSQYAALYTMYPGDNYVDWTAIDVYNKYSTWAGLNPLLTGSGGMTWYKNSYNIILDIAPNKPMMLSEFASIEAGDGGTKKAAWITDALTNQIPNNFPKIKAVVWMNWDINAGRTYPIESSQRSMDAWTAGIRSGIYATNQYGSLNASPIPPLAASSSGGSVTLPAIADSYIDGANPDSTAGGANNVLYVKGSPVMRTFLKFDLSPLAGRTISTVKLKVKTALNSASGSVDSSNIKLITNVDWKEQYLSYNNSVPLSATVLGTLPPNSAPNTWYEVTLTPSEVQPYAGGLFSMAVASTSADGLFLFSRETADKPKLIITYR